MQGPPEAASARGGGSHTARVLGEFLAARASGN